MYSDTGVLGIADQPLIMILLIVLAYFIGNISPSILLGKMAGIDIRDKGSGNAGTTNTLRVLGKKPAVIVLVIDILKGTITVVLYGILFGQGMAMFAALATFMGHVWPAVFGFRGGKGVATAFGVLVALHPGLGFACLGIVALVVVTTKRMSPGSVTGGVVCPILTYFLLPKFFPLSLLMAAILIFKHRENIKRIIKGEEPPMSIFDKSKKEKKTRSGRPASEVTRRK